MVLPDFPLVKQQFKKELRRFIVKRMRAGSVARLVTHKQIFEGDRLTGSVRASQSDASTFREISSERSLKRQCIVESGTEAWVELALSTCDEMIGAQSKFILDDISKAADQVGHTVSGKQWTFELFLDGLRRMTLSFDDSGNPNLQLILTPESNAAIKNERWNERPDYKARWDEVIEEKRAEWLREEENKRIVD